MTDGVHQFALVQPGKNAKVCEEGVEVAVVGNSHYSKDWLGFMKVPEFNQEKLKASNVIILDAGGYGEAMSDPWPDSPRPASVLIEDRKAELICRRESLDDLFQQWRKP